MANSCKIFTPTEYVRELLLNEKDRDSILAYYEKDEERWGTGIPRLIREMKEYGLFFYR